MGRIKKTYSKNILQNKDFFGEKQQKTEQRPQHAERKATSNLSNEGVWGFPAGRLAYHFC